MTLHVHASGPTDAPSIVFLHGAGISSWMWTDQIKALNDRYHCLAIDLPNSGESHRTTWQSLADSADQVAAIIGDRAANGRAHVVGLSLGGYTALTLLERHPERVERLIVSGVTGRPFKNQRRWKLLLGVVSRLIHFKPYIAMNARMMQLPPDAKAALERDMLRMPPASLRRIYDEIVPFALPAVLAERDHPVLAVAGEKEAADVTGTLDAFTALLPNATTAVAPGAHHGWNGEFPDLFTAMIEAWVNDKPLPAALTVNA